MFRKLTKQETAAYILNTKLGRVPLTEPVLTEDATGNELKTGGIESMRFGKYLGKHDNGFVVMLYDRKCAVAGGEWYRTLDDLQRTWRVD